MQSPSAAYVARWGESPIAFVNAVRAVLRLGPIPTPNDLSKNATPRGVVAGWVPVGGRKKPRRPFRAKRAGDRSSELAPGSPRQRRVRESFPFGETVREADEEGGWWG